MRSADCQLSIVVVRSRTEGANTLDEIETRSALADIVDQFFIKSTFRHNRGRRLGRRGPDFETLAGFSVVAFNIFVALDAVAGKSTNIVSGVRRADVTYSLDAIIAIVTDAPLISVDFVSIADGVVRVERMALSVLPVVADDTDTLTEDIIVDLIVGAIDLLRFRISHWRGVGIFSCERVVSIIGSVSEVHGGLWACANDSLVGLRTDGENIPGRASLRVEQNKQEGKEDRLY